MASYRLHRNADGSVRIEVPLAGTALLHHAICNKGTAFTREERALFGLEGLLPDHVSALEQQAERIYGHINSLPHRSEDVEYLVNDFREDLADRLVRFDG